jgi:hypothetical protein
MNPINVQAGMDSPRPLSPDEDAWGQTNGLREQLVGQLDHSQSELAQLRTHREQAHETFARHEQALVERIQMCEAALRSNQPDVVAKAHPDYASSR